MCESITKYPQTAATLHQVIHTLLIQLRTSTCNQSNKPTLGFSGANVLTKLSTNLGHHHPYQDLLDSLRRCRFQVMRMSASKCECFFLVLRSCCCCNKPSKRHRISEFFSAMKSSKAWSSGDSMTLGTAGRDVIWGGDVLEIFDINQNPEHIQA